MKIYICLMFIIVVTCCKKENDLSKLNNVQMPYFEQEILTTKSKDTLKVLIFGNSIATHPASPEIGWNHKSGMAATKIENDYIHQLLKRISTSTNQNIILKYSNFADFERSHSSFDLDNNSKIKSLYNFKPQILIYQLGDNVDDINMKTFISSSIELLNHFQNSNNFIVSPYFNSSNNFEASKNIAKQSKSIFVDISEVSKNPINTAQGQKTIFTVKGIYDHPGDTGMKKISDIIFEKIYKSRIIKH